MIELKNIKINALIRDFDYILTLNDMYAVVSASVQTIYHLCPDKFDESLTILKELVSSYKDVLRFDSISGIVSFFTLQITNGRILTQIRLPETPNYNKPNSKVNLEIYNYFYTVIWKECVNGFIKYSTGQITGEIVVVVPVNDVKKFYDIGLNTEEIKRDLKRLFFCNGIQATVYQRKENDKIIIKVEKSI